MRVERDVFWGERAVGRAQVQRQGLYYVFTCRCRLSGDTVWRLCATCGEKQADLGVLVPVEGGVGLTTRRPVKLLGEGKIQFAVQPRHDRKTRFSPIYPEEPFAYLQRLKDAFLEERNGLLGAAWPEQGEP